MDNSFLSPQNIDNIYEYINADMVKNHNINLDNDSKNKKIVKKLTKTVFAKLNTDFNQSGNNKSIGINSFNDMVSKKCVPFLLNKANVQDTSSKVEKKKPRRYSVKKNQGIKNFDLNIGETNLKHGNELTSRKSSKKQSGNYQAFINDADDFDALVKESNKQINDSFKAYSEKQTVFNSHDSINDSCNNNEISSDFIVDRCAIKDDIVNVKNGYGRNFLIPQGKAILATTSEKKILSENIKQKAFKEKKIIDNANSLAKKILKTQIKIKSKAGAGDKLFGSVNASDFSKVLKNAGFEIEKNQISLPGKTIKRLGKYEASIRLHREVVVNHDFEIISE